MRKVWEKEYYLRASDFDKFNHIKPSAVLDVFQIDYRKEVLQGTELRIYHTKQDNTVLAKGQNENGDIMFACKLEYKN